MTAGQWRNNGSANASTWLVAILLLSIASNAGAQFYIAPEVIYTYPDQGPFKKDEQSLGLGIGAAIYPGWDAQLEYDSQIFETDTGQFLRKNVLLTGQHSWWATRWTHPYLSFGAGAVHISKGSNQSTAPSLSLGAGYTLRFPGVRTWDIQTEVRGRYAYDEHAIAGNQDLVDGQALLRVRYGGRFEPLMRPRAQTSVQLGEASDPSATTPVQVLTTGTGRAVRYSLRDDRDQDGIPNARDRCPSTIKGVSVDADGCMIATFH